jgi:RNA polymerase sigma-70 factor, ECF subfamily
VAQDATLVRAVARGDIAAFEDLYERYARLVYSAAVRLVGLEAAEDVAQDVFLNLWRRAGHFDPERGCLQAWLLGITRHAAVDRLRRRAVQARGQAALAAREADQPLDGVADAVVDRSEARRLHRALARLPEPQRNTLALAYLGGRTQEEIATLTSAPLGTVKGRVRLGLTHLRTRLAVEA